MTDTIDDIKKILLLLWSTSDLRTAKPNFSEDITVSGLTQGVGGKRGIWRGTLSEKRKNVMERPLIRISKIPSLQLHCTANIQILDIKYKDVF